MLAVLGCSRILCWWSWAALGAYVGGLGPLLGLMLLVWAALGPKSGPNPGALGAYVGDLGPLLGPMLAVLGRSWGLSWRSWAALRAYVGGLGTGSGPKLAVLGPKWSVLEAIRAEKWPKPEREGLSGEGIVFHCFPVAGILNAFDL